MKAGIGGDTGLASFAAKTEIITRTRIVTPVGNGKSGKRKIVASVLNRKCMGAKNAGPHYASNAPRRRHPLNATGCQPHPG